MINSTTTAGSTTTILRWLALGDVWRYQVEGSLTSNGRSQELSGSVVVSVEPDSLSQIAGALVLVFRQTLLVVRADGVPEPLPAMTGMFSFIQDQVTRDVLIVADNMGHGGAGRLAKRPQIFYPGRWSRNTDYDNRLEFGAGAFVRNTLAVIEQESVETPAGTYPTWVARITSEGSAMGRLSGIDWWAPELGAPARFETHATIPDGEIMRLRAALSSMSVDHGAA